MSWAAIRWAYECAPRDLSGPEHAILVALAYHRNHETGLTCPSIRTLADAARMNRSTAIRAVEGLVRRAVIEVRRRRGHRTEYVLPVEKLVALRDRFDPSLEDATGRSPRPVVVALRDQTGRSPRPEPTRNLQLNRTTTEDGMPAYSKADQIGNRKPKERKSRYIAAERRTVERREPPPREPPKSIPEILGGHADLYRRMVAIYPVPTGTEKLAATALADLDPDAETGERILAYLQRVRRGWNPDPQYRTRLWTLLGSRAWEVASDDAPDHRSDVPRADDADLPPIPGLREMLIADGTLRA